MTDLVSRGRRPPSGSPGPGRARCPPRSRRWSPARASPLAGGFRPAAALLALVVSLALQVGVNYANDYSDGIRGTDADRVGPLRLVGSGLAAPGRGQRAALASFAVAGLAGLGLVILTGTGGCWRSGRPACSRPGPTPAAGARTATAGWARCSSSSSSAWSPWAAPRTCRSAGSAWPPLLTGVAIGALACAILVANNLRDIAGDAARRQADPGHPARRPRGTRLLYAGPGRPGRAGHRRGRRADLALGAARPGRPAAAGPRPAHGAAGGQGAALIAVLKTTGLAELVSAVALAAGLVLASIV